MKFLIRLSKAIVGWAVSTRAMLLSVVGRVLRIFSSAMFWLLILSLGGAFMITVGVYLMAGTAIAFMAGGVFMLVGATILFRGLNNG